MGDGNYITQTWLSPNVSHARGTTAPGGGARFEEESSTIGGGQLVRTIFETWLEFSPIFNGSGIGAAVDVNGGTQTTVLWEMDPRWIAFQWPQSIERKLGTTLLSKATVSYDESTPSGSSHIVVEATRRDYSSSSAYVETVTKSFRPDVSDNALRGRLYSVQLPTGAKQSFAYASGGWSGTGWSADFRITTLSGATSGGTAVTGVDGATLDSLQMHANKSTKTVEYLNDGRLVRREVWVYVTGSGTSPSFNTGDPVAWETFGYTVDGRLASRTSSTGSSYSATWAGTRKTWHESIGRGHALTPDKSAKSLAKNPKESDRQ